MKQHFLFAITLFAILLVTTSCEKEEEETPIPTISIEGTYQIFDISACVCEGSDFLSLGFGKDGCIIEPKLIVFSGEMEFKNGIYKLDLDFNQSVTVGNSEFVETATYTLDGNMLTLCYTENDCEVITIDLSDDVLMLSSEPKEDDCIHTIIANKS